MTVPARVVIHPSQFPEAVRRELLASLRTRRVNHQFHYDSTKQTQQWLVLHQVHSPARHDAETAANYDRAFAAAATRLAGRTVHLIGLGCGGGQKDTRCLRQLQAAGCTMHYTPCDVATAMVLVARAAALAVVPDPHCHPFVCDLARADGLAEAFAVGEPPDAVRLLTFFGMIPNFEPEEILPRLAALVRPDDTLLFSANLAPGQDYGAGVRQVLPQYDNPLTRAWLLTFLLDLGVERDDGELRFGIEAGGLDLLRVVAFFTFTRARRLEVDRESFAFAAGDRVRLFFSYRHTPGLVSRELRHHGLEVEQQWLAASGEEGVFLVRRIAR
jgi:L-histidine N-alpha-methyltransferase